MTTTFRAFPFLRKGFLVPFIEWCSLVNFCLQVMGSGALAYKIIHHVERRLHHENNIELFILTTPFSILQGILLLRPHLKLLGHSFYIKYLTLQMFLGTMIVFSRDKYGLWGSKGLESLYARILIEFLPMIPFFMMILPTMLARKKVD
jgi:hypothetical protein